MKKLTTAAKAFWKDEAGATAIEYGLMVALIAVVIVSAVQSIGDTLSDKFQKIADCLLDSSKCAAKSS